MASLSAIKAGRAFVELFADNTKLQAGLRLAEAEMKNFGARVAEIGRSIAMVSFVPAFGAGWSLKLFAGFDDTMRTVKAVTQATGQEFDNLSQKARNLGATTSFTAQQVADGMLQLGRSGFQTKEIEGSIKGVMDLARSTGTEMATASQLVGNTLRTFQMDASESAHVSDVLSAATNNSAMNLEEMAEALKHTAPVASQAGMSLEDTAKVIGTLANYGIKGSLAGTAVKNILARMADPAVRENYRALGIEVMDANGNLRNMAQILHEVGAATEGLGNAEKLSIFRELFDMRALAGGSAMTKAEMDKLETAIDNAAGYAEKTAKEMDAGIGGTFRIFLSAFHEMCLTIAEELVPSVKEGANAIQEIIYKIRDWVKENSASVVGMAKFIVTALKIGAVMFGVGMGIKAVAFSFGAFRSGITLTHGILKVLTYDLRGIGPLMKNWRNMFQKIEVPNTGPNPKASTTFRSYGQAARAAAGPVERLNAAIAQTVELSTGANTAVSSMNAEMKGFAANILAAARPMRSLVVSIRAIDRKLADTAKKVTACAEAFGLFGPAAQTSVTEAKAFGTAVGTVDKGVIALNGSIGNLLTACQSIPKMMAPSMKTLTALAERFTAISSSSVTMDTAFTSIGSSAVTAGEGFTSLKTAIDGLTALVGNLTKSLGWNAEAAATTAKSVNTLAGAYGRLAANMQKAMVGPVAGIKTPVMPTAPTTVSSASTAQNAQKTGAAGASQVKTAATTEEAKAVGTLSAVEKEETATQKVSTAAKTENIAVTETAKQAYFDFAAAEESVTAAEETTTAAVNAESTSMSRAEMVHQKAASSAGIFANALRTVNVSLGLTQSSIDSICAALGIASTEMTSQAKLIATGLDTVSGATVRANEQVALFDISVQRMNKTYTGLVPVTNESALSYKTLGQNLAALIERVNHTEAAMNPLWSAEKAVADGAALVGMQFGLMTKEAIAAAGAIGQMQYQMSAMTGVNLSGSMAAAVKQVELYNRVNSIGNKNAIANEMAYAKVLQQKAANLHKEIAAKKQEMATRQLAVNVLKKEIAARLASDNADKNRIAAQQKMVLSTQTEIEVLNAEIAALERLVIANEQTAGSYVAMANARKAGDAAAFQSASKSAADATKIANGVNIGAGALNGAMAIKNVSTAVGKTGAEAGKAAGMFSKLMAIIGSSTIVAGAGKAFSSFASAIGTLCSNLLTMLGGMIAVGLVWTGLGKGIEWVTKKITGIDFKFKEVGDSIDLLDKKIKKLNDSKSVFENLIKLSEKSKTEKLSNEEYSQAVNGVNELRAGYGDLGFVVDEVNKKISMSFDTVKRFEDIQKSNLTKGIDDEIASLQEFINVQRKAIDDRYKFVNSFAGYMDRYARTLVKIGTLGMFGEWQTDAIEKYMENTNKEYEKALKQLEELRKKKKEIELGTSQDAQNVGAYYTPIFDLNAFSENMNKITGVITSEIEAITKLQDDWKNAQEEFQRMAEFNPEDAEDIKKQKDEMEIRFNEAQKKLIDKLPQVQAMKEFDKEIKVSGLTDLEKQVQELDQKLADYTKNISEAAEFLGLSEEELAQKIAEATEGINELKNKAIAEKAEEVNEAVRGAEVDEDKMRLASLEGEKIAAEREMNGIDNLNSPKGLQARQKYLQAQKDLEEYEKKVNEENLRRASERRKAAEENLFEEVDGKKVNKLQEAQGKFREAQNKKDAAAMAQAQKEIEQLIKEKSKFDEATDERNEALAYLRDYYSKERELNSQVRDAELKLLKARNDDSYKSDAERNKAVQKAMDEFAAANEKRLMQDYQNKADESLRSAQDDYMVKLNDYNLAEISGNELMMQEAQAALEEADLNLCRAQYKEALLAVRDATLKTASAELDLANAEQQLKQAREQYAKNSSAENYAKLNDAKKAVSNAQSSLKSSQVNYKYLLEALQYMNPGLALQNAYPDYSNPSSGGGGGGKGGDNSSQDFKTAGSFDPSDLGVNAGFQNWQKTNSTQQLNTIKEIKELLSSRSQYV